MDYEFDLITKVSIKAPSFEVISVNPSVNGKSAVLCKMSLGSPQADVCVIEFFLYGFMNDGSKTLEDAETWMNEKIKQYEV